MFKFLRESAEPTCSSPWDDCFTLDCGSLFFVKRDLAALEGLPGDCL